MRVHPSKFAWRNATRARVRRPAPPRRISRPPRPSAEIPKPLDDVGVEARQVELVDENPSLPRARAKDAVRQCLARRRRIPDVPPVAGRIRQLAAHVAAESDVGNQLLAPERPLKLARI